MNVSNFHVAKIAESFYHGIQYDHDVEMQKKKKVLYYTRYNIFFPHKQNNYMHFLLL